MDDLFFNSLEEFSIEKREYCFLMSSAYKYTSTFKVYIPKLMPMFNLKDTAKTWKDTFDDKIFVNESTNMPQTTPVMQLQNYLTVQRARNAWFKYHASTFDKATRLLCEIPEKNLRHIRILDEDFNVDLVEKQSIPFIRNPLYEILDKIEVGDTVQASYQVFTRTDLSSCEGLNIEHDSQGHDDDEFSYTYIYSTPSHSHPRMPVDSERKYCYHSSIEMGEGIVKEKQEWGLIITINGVDRHISPQNIIGFYKKAGEYYSYFEDSYIGDG